MHDRKVARLLFEPAQRLTKANLEPDQKPETFLFVFGFSEVKCLFTTLLTSMNWTMYMCIPGSTEYTT